MTKKGSFILLLFCFHLTACVSSYQGPVSDHFNGRTFHYPGESKRSENVLYSLFVLWRAINQNPWPSSTSSSLITPPLKLGSNKITWINHSTVLLETEKVNILFDPIYSERASPLPWIGPVRKCKPALPFNKLPRIDLVLISHNHYDHLDLPTLKKLKRAFHPLFIVPLGNQRLFKQHFFTNVIQLDWWQSYTYKNAQITLLPARHNSSRFWLDHNKSLWGSYGVKIGDKRFYFAGDTGYADHFKHIRRRWGSPYFSMIPIGAYRPRSILHRYHLNPKEAVQSHLDLNSQYSLAIHWGCFQLSAELIDEPVNDLDAARRSLGVSKRRFFAAHETDKTG